MIDMCDHVFSPFRCLFYTKSGGHYTLGHYRFIDFFPRVAALLDLYMVTLVRHVAQRALIYRADDTIKK